MLVPVYKTSRLTSQDSNMVTTSHCKMRLKIMRNLPWTNPLLLQSKRTLLPSCTFAICLDTGLGRSQIVLDSLSIRVPILYQTSFQQANCPFARIHQPNNSEYTIMIVSKRKMTVTGSSPIHTYNSLIGGYNIMHSAVLQHFSCPWTKCVTCLQHNIPRSVSTFMIITTITTDTFVHMHFRPGFLTLFMRLINVITS
jgi:hypothetical protein